MRRIRIELCYDGSEYSGWQIQSKQPKVRTVQGELERAICKVVGQEAEVIGSGRTDAGVHALFQVAAFNTDSELPTEVLSRALNAFLPRDIRIWRAVDAPLDFHPIHDVKRKRYRYLASDSRPAFPFFKHYVWNLIKKVDLNAMKDAASFLLGRHDMSAFQTQGSPRKSTERTVFDVKVGRAALDKVLSFPKLTDWEERNARIAMNAAAVGNAFPFAPELIVFEIEADGFLYNMVRAIVGTLYLFGTRDRRFQDPERMRDIIEKADRSLAGPTAPAHGLYMIDVVYPERAGFR